MEETPFMEGYNACQNVSVLVFNGILLPNIPIQVALKTRSHKSLPYVPVIAQACRVRDELRECTTGSLPSSGG